MSCFKGVTLDALETPFIPVAPATQLDGGRVTRKTVSPFPWGSLRDLRSSRFGINLLVFGNLCKRLAAHKGYGGYLWMGGFLGVIGLLYVIGLPDRTLQETFENALRRVKNDL